MFTVQASLLAGGTGAGKFEYAGSGVFGQVWFHPDGETVIKRCRSDDGTLAWLYWCYCRRAELLPGMPEVHSLVLLEGGGYVVTMAKYLSCQSDEPCGDVFTEACFQPYSGPFCNDPAICSTVAAYQEDYRSMMRFGDEDFIDYSEQGMDDIHRGNVMLCKQRGLIITDPSCGEVNREHLWILAPSSDGFQLEMQ